MYTSKHLHNPAPHFPFIFIAILLSRFRYLPLSQVPSGGYFESVAIRTDMTTVYVNGKVLGGETPVGYKVDIIDGATVVATANGVAGKEIAIPVSC
jgi:hypothetical protein